MSIQNNSNCHVYDLVEYKLKKWVDSFYQDSEEWHHAMHILAAYLEGEVTIQWSKGKIEISSIDGETSSLDQQELP
jgi:hypothetical protein